MTLQDRYKKLNWQQFADLYDHYYDKVSALLYHYDPCKIVNNKCEYRCFCCQDCKHLSTQGCTIRSLYCKLWLCPQAESNTDPKLVTKLRQLMWECRDLGLIWYRSSKLEVFERHHKSI